MAAKPLPMCEIGGSVREPNPRARKPDGSIIVQCVGGPCDRKEIRLYPPFDTPVEFPTGFYQLSPSPRVNGKDVLTFSRKEEVS